MADIKLTSDEGSMADRVNKRLRNSGAGAKPDVTVQTGYSPQRVFTNIHHGGPQQGSRIPNANGKPQRGGV